MARVSGSPENLGGSITTNSRARYWTGLMSFQSVTLVATDLSLRASDELGDDTVAGGGGGAASTAIFSSKLSSGGIATSSQWLSSHSRPRSVSRTKSSYGAGFSQYGCSNHSGQKP